MCIYMYVAFYSLFHSLSDGEPECGTGVALSLSQLLQLTPRPEMCMRNTTFVHVQLGELEWVNKMNVLMRTSEWE